MNRQASIIANRVWVFQEFPSYRTCKSLNVSQWQQIAVDPDDMSAWQLHPRLTGMTVKEHGDYIATENGFYHVGWGVAAPNFSSPTPCGGSRRWPTETDEGWLSKVRYDMREFSRRVYCAMQFKDYDYKPGD